MRELGVHRIEVHVAAVCTAWTADGSLRVLAVRRALTKQLYPALWEGPGGQVHAGESLEQAVLRHLADELGLRGRTSRPFTTYLIEPGPSGATETIPGVRFIAELPFDSPSLDPREHGEFRWLTVDELASVDWIPGVLEQVLEAVSIVLGDAS